MSTLVCKGVIGVLELARLKSIDVMLDCIDTGELVDVELFKLMLCSRDVSDKLGTVDWFDVVLLVP